MIIYNLIKEVLYFTKGNLYFVIFLFLIMSILEIIGISMFFPLLNNEESQLNTFFNGFLSNLGLKASTELILIVLISVFILKGIIQQLADVSLSRIIVNMALNIRKKVFWYKAKKIFCPTQHFNICF